MSAPPPKKLLRLTRSMERYDFSKAPLKEADIVIDKSGRICKYRTGKAGGDATPEQLGAAEDARPNR
jgi:hypothetical protein